MYRLASLLLLLPTLALALPEDQQQPITITADRFELDRNSGVGTYRGNVELIRGSLHLTAETLTLYREGEELSRVVAEGTPVHFRQQPAADAQEIVGYGQHLEYLVIKNKVELTGDAHLQQGGDEFSGAKIVYDTATAVIQATGQGRERIKVILQPRDEQGATGSPQ